MVKDRLCQYCGKGPFKNNKTLHKHEELNCPKRPGAPVPLAKTPMTPGPEDLPKVEPEELTIKGPEKTATQGQGYHCVDCGYGRDFGEPIRKGTANCPGCGAELDFGALDNA